MKIEININKNPECENESYITAHLYLSLEDGKEKTYYSGQIISNDDPFIETINQVVRIVITESLHINEKGQDHDNPSPSNITA